MKAWVLRECNKRGYRCVFDVATAKKMKSRTAEKKQKNQESEEIFCIAIVSLSGGVDSMVKTRVLCDLRDRAKLLPLSASKDDVISGKKKPYSRPLVEKDEVEDDDDKERKTFSVACVHIDYGNRSESGAEAAYLDGWCRSKRVEVKMTAMPENLRRGSTAREDYEREARTLRFAAYKRSLESPFCAVLLGHHRGDLEENCLSNVLRGASVLELSGMAVDDVLYGVRVARPLLGDDKKDVFDVAHRLGVPYFKDTTPLWSTRGRLRNELLPLLREVYGSGCGRNLERLAKETDALKDILSQRVFGPFRGRAVKSSVGVAADTKPFKTEGLFFWRSVLRDLGHELGVGALSEKALRIFMAKVRGRRQVVVADKKDHQMGGRRRQKETASSSSSFDDDNDMTSGGDTTLATAG